MAPSNVTIDIKPIRVADIIISKFNRRQLAPDDPGVKSLAESMERSGQLVPVIVRSRLLIENGNMKYELLAGVRRFHAAQHLGWETINAEVVEADDQRAMIIITTENLQREDLSPFEEAESLKILIDRSGGAGEPDIKAIASDLGRSPQWVARRIRLLELTPEWQEAIKKEFINWSAGHFELIARYDPETQNMMLEELKERVWHVARWTVDELDKQCGQFMHLLKKAPWKLDDETLDPEAGSCLNCLRRSCCQSLLFEPEDLGEDKVKANDKCLDKACWDKKLEAHINRQIVRQQEKFPSLAKIATDYYRGNEKDILNKHDYSNVKKSDPGALPAVVVFGPGSGSLRWIKPLNTGVAKTRKKKDKDGKPVSPTVAERQARLKARRDAWIVTELRNKLPQSKFAGGVDSIIGLAAVFGTKYRSDSFYHNSAVWKEYSKLSGLDTADLIQRLWNEIATVFVSRLNYQNADGAAERMLEVERLCGLTGLDFEEICRQAEEAIPVPKSLAKQLEGDGENKKRPKTKPDKKRRSEKAKKVKKEQ